MYKYLTFIILISGLVIFGFSCTGNEGNSGEINYNFNEEKSMEERKEELTEIRNNFLGISLSLPEGYKFDEGDSYYSTVSRELEDGEFIDLEIRGVKVYTQEHIKNKPYIPAIEIVLLPSSLSLEDVFESDWANMKEEKHLKFSLIDVVHAMPTPSYLNIENLEEVNFNGKDFYYYAISKDGVRQDIFLLERGDYDYYKIIFNEQDKELIDETLSKLKFIDGIYVDQFEKNQENKMIYIDHPFKEGRKFGYRDIWNFHEIDDNNDLFYLTYEGEEGTALIIYYKNSTTQLFKELEEVCLDSYDTESDLYKKYKENVCESFSAYGGGVFCQNENFYYYHRCDGKSQNTYFEARYYGKDSFGKDWIYTQVDNLRLKG